MAEDDNQLFLGLDQDFFSSYKIPNSPTMISPMLAGHTAPEAFPADSFDRTLSSDPVFERIKNRSRAENGVHILSLEPSPFAAGLRIINGQSLSPKLTAKANPRNSPHSLPSLDSEESEVSSATQAGKGRPTTPDVERKKRHNQLETKRRTRLRSQFDEIRSLLDVSGDKSAVLEEVISFIRETKEHKEQIARQTSVMQMDSLTPSNRFIKTGEDANSVLLNFTAVFETNPVAMAVARLDGKFIDCNKKFIELTGFDKAQITSTTLFATMDEQYLPKFFAAISSLMSGEMPVFTKESQCKRRCGKMFCARVLVSVARNELGTPLFFSVVGIPLQYLTKEDQVTSETSQDVTTRE